MSRQRRKRKNNSDDLIFPILVLLSILIYFNTDFFIALLKFLFLFLILGGILFLLFKTISKKTPPSINTDPIIYRHNTNITATWEPRNYRSFTNIVNSDKPTAWSLALLQEIDWKNFEELCFNYFESLGYKAKMSSQGADEGVDIYLYKKAQPDKLFGMVQCKRWNKPVGVDPIRAFFGVQIDKKLPLAIFISSSGFSKTALSFCENKHLKLMSGEELLNQIQNLSPEVQKNLLHKVTEGDYKTPTCVKCDTKMVLRTSKKSGKKFWGCKNYPKCKTTLYLSKYS